MKYTLVAALFALSPIFNTATASSVRIKFNIENVGPSIDSNISYRIKQVGGCYRSSEWTPISGDASVEHPPLTLHNGTCGETGTVPWAFQLEVPARNKGFSDEFVLTTSGTECTLKFSIENGLVGTSGSCRKK